MITRRSISLAGGIVVLASLGFPAYPDDSFWKIGYIGISPIGSPEGERVFDSLLIGLSQDGFVEGKNIAVERRSINGDPDRSPQVVADLIGRGVNVLVVSGTATTRAAKEATNTIPIVTASLSNPVASGLVSSLGRPGGNLTGVTNFDIDLNPKRLELLKSAVPGAARLLLIQDNRYIFDARTASTINRNLNEAARSLGVRLLEVAVATRQDMEQLNSLFGHEQVDGIVVGEIPAISLIHKELSELALRHRLPMLAPVRFAADDGVLLAYGPDLPELFRLAGGYVAKILNGAKPAELPMQQPTKVELIVNLKTADAIGTPISRQFLLRADAVIH